MGAFIYGDNLTASTALAITRGEVKAELGQQHLDKIRQSRRIVSEIAQGDAVVYGINSGFGPLCTTKISPEQTQALQTNILKSHSVGVGDPIPAEIAKLMLILKAQSLSLGYSGVRVATLERIVWHINHDIIPMVPSQGSVGASGDLAPLAHLFLPLIGLGQVHYQGSVVETGKMLQQEGIKPLELAPKEGLALINGTQLMAAFGIRVLQDFHRC